MTNSELFTAAHKLAKTFEGNYTACFILALYTIKNTTMENPIENLKEQVTSANVAKEEGRQMVVNSCRELYNIIETGLYNKYGQSAVNDAYNDLCNGNFSEPFMCEQKKSKFQLYSNIYLSRIA